MPIGACLAAPEVAASFVPGDHATTFGGGPVQCAAALAVLDVIDNEGLLEHVAGIGKLIKDELGQLGDAMVEVRGLGLLIAVQLHSDISRDVATAALDRHVLVNDVTPSAVRLCPPLVITEEEARRGAAVVAECIKEQLS